MYMPMDRMTGIGGLGSEPILIPEPPQSLSDAIIGRGVSLWENRQVLPIPTDIVSSIAPGETENAIRAANLGSRPQATVPLTQANAWANASPAEKAAFLQAMRALPWSDRYTVWPEFQTSTNLANLSFSLLGGALAVFFVLIVTSGSSKSK